MGKKKSINRLGMFDLAKGIGMIIIVASHILGYFEVNYMGISVFLLLWYIGCGLMPMFFMISGYSMRKRPMGKCIRQQVQFYIRPYIYTAVITTLAYGIVHYLTFHLKEGAVTETKNMAMTFLFGISTPGSKIGGYEFHKGIVAIWFFLAMFIGWNIVNALLHIHNQKLITGLVVLCVAAGYGLTFVGTTPWCISQGLISTGYIYAGYLIKKKKLFEKKLSPLITASMIVMTIICCIFGTPQMAYNTWKLGPIDIIGAGFIGYLVIRVCFVCDRKEMKITNLIKVVGKYSYWIIPIHCFEIMVYHWDMFGMYPKYIGPIYKYKAVRFTAQVIICTAILFVGCIMLNYIRKWSRKNGRQLNNGNTKTNSL